MGLAKCRRFAVTSSYFFGCESQRHVAASRGMQAHGLLAAFAAAVLVVSVATVDATGATWTEIPYPVGNAKHYVGASPGVHINSIDEAGHIGYHTIYRDNVVPAAFAGTDCMSCLVYSLRVR